MKLEWHPPEIKSRSAHLVSEPEHSIYVVYGFQRTDGTIAPARDFFTAAVAETDIERSLSENWNQGSDRAFESTVEALHDKIREVIQDERWRWDRETERKNGAIAGLLRDIPDTGELLDRQTIEWIE